MSELLLETRVPRDTVAHQTLVEHQILKHVGAALKVALAWQVSSVGYERKLSSVRFTAQSFERHLERLFNLEEAGGYLEFARDEQPTLAAKIEALRHEHVEFRSRLSDILSAMLELTAHEEGCFYELCEQLEHLLERLDRHHAKEIQLIQLAMVDLGGEG